MIFKSITLRMVAATIFLVALVTITFSQIFLFQVRHALNDDFERQSTSLTENLARNAELGLLLEDHESLNKLGETLLAEETVTQVRFRDRNGNVLIALDKPLSRNAFLVTFSSPVRLTRPVGEFDVFSEQVLDPYELGVAEVVFSQARLQRLIEKLQRRIYSFALIGIIVGGIIAYYLAWVTLKPVKRIAQATKEIAAGNWDMRVAESGDDEIGQLTRYFNVMAESLVTKRKELQESYHQLAKRERLAEIGRFSTIVAHEMKKPVGYYQGRTQHSCKTGRVVKTKETMRGYIDEEVTRLNHLAEEFLEFARPPIPKKDRFELRETVNKAKALTEARKVEGKEVAVTIAGCDEDSVVFGDKNLIFQALLNLIGNSIEACSDQVSITMSLHANDTGTVLTITDNGPGYQRKEDREQIFEPLFHKKREGDRSRSVDCTKDYRLTRRTNNV